MIQARPILKLATSVLSLESEEEIDVSAQNKSVVLLLPRQIWLLCVVRLPDGEFALPASVPIQTLLLPVVNSYPAVYPTVTLLPPVVMA